MTASADALRGLSTTGLLEHFLALEAPDIAEMHGEYAARLLAQPNWLATLAGQAVLANPWRAWLCKAFRPVDATTGRGYNTFLEQGRIVQRYPMLTRLAPSRFDGRPAYQLVYRHFHSACGSVHMVDEVRRLDTGLYLGIGTWGFTRAQRQIPYPFLLAGPGAPYRGDIGRERRGFHVGPRETPAFFTP